VLVSQALSMIAKFFYNTLCYSWKRILDHSTQNVPAIRFDNAGTGFGGTVRILIIRMGYGREDEEKKNQTQKLSGAYHATWSQSRGFC
jgi:hypothetical protein